MSLALEYGDALRAADLGPAGRARALFDTALAAYLAAAAARELVLEGFGLGGGSA